MEPLTVKQRKFIVAYTGAAGGNAAEAARMAGYKHARQAAYEVVRIPKVLKALQAIQESDPLIILKTDRMRVLSEMIRDPNVSNRDRLSAIDLLCKMNGDHIHRVKAEGSIALTFADLVLIAEKEEANGQ